MRGLLAKKNVYLKIHNAYKILEIGPGPGAFVKVWMESFSKSLQNLSPFKERQELVTLYFIIMSKLYLQTTERPK